MWGTLLCTPRDKGSQGFIYLTSGQGVASRTTVDLQWRYVFINRGWFRKWDGRQGRERVDCAAHLPSICIVSKRSRGGM